MNDLADRLITQIADLTGLTDDVVRRVMEAADRLRLENPEAWAQIEAHVRQHDAERGR